MAKKVVHRDNLRIVLNIVFAISQILGGYFFTFFNVGVSVASQSSQAQTPVIPAGYAFSIWGLIFASALVYAVYQALPQNRENALLRKIGFFTAFAFLGNTIWELVAQLVTFGWPTVVFIVLILAFSLFALFSLTSFMRKKKLSTKEIICVYLPVSVLAGWVSVATFANISSVMYQLDYYPLGLSLTALSIIILLFAAIFAGFVIVKSNANYLYTLAVVWALVAIVVANTTRASNVWVATVAGMLIVVVLGVQLIVKSVEKNTK